MLAELPSEQRESEREGGENRKEVAGEEVVPRRRDMPRVSPEGLNRVRVPDPLIFWPRASVYRVKRNTGGEES